MPILVVTRIVTAQLPSFHRTFVSPILYDAVKASGGGVSCPPVGSDVACLNVFDGGGAVV